MAILPAAISVISAIGLCVVYWKKFPESTLDGYFLRSFASCGITAAVLLMTVTILDNSMPLPLWARIFTFVVFLVLIAFPLFIGLLFQGTPFPNQASTGDLSDNVVAASSNVSAGSTEDATGTRAGSGNHHNAWYALLRKVILCGTNDKEYQFLDPIHFCWYVYGM